MAMSSGLGDLLTESKFQVKQADVTVSNKVMMKAQRPC